MFTSSDKSEESKVNDTGRHVSGIPNAVYQSPFTDKRPVVRTQENLQLMADSSSQLGNLQSFQRLLNPAPIQTTTAPVQRAIDDDLQALEDDYQTTEDPLLRRILHEVRLLSDIEFTSVNDPEYGHAERENQNDPRSHLINLDPRILDPVTRQSLLLHEMIHVSADRKYNVNQTGEPEPAITAVINPLDTERDRLADIGRQNKHREGLANHLINVVKGDWVVENKVSELVLGRVQRIMGATHREFDSVVTELYYRLKKMGADERTDTFKEIAAMTAAAYRSRHESQRLDRTYVEPMKTGFFG